MDQDNVSVSSFTSNTSNTSDSNEIPANLGDTDIDKKDEDNSQPDELVQDSNTDETDHLKADQNDASTEMSHESHGNKDEIVKDDNIVIENEDRNIVEAHAEDQINDKTDDVSEHDTKENNESVDLQGINADSSDNSVHTAEQDKCDKESKVPSTSSENLKDEVHIKNSPVSDNLEANQSTSLISDYVEANKTKTDPQISVEGYDSISVKSSGTESDTVSTLDKEIARLNSYLSQTSDCSTSEQETTPQSLSSSIRARKEVEGILLKNSQMYRDLEDEITRNYGKNQTEYKESDLDKQLKQLDFEASSSSDMGTTKSPVFSPDTSPSIYTLYKMPSVSQDDIYGAHSPYSLESESSLGAVNLPSEKKLLDSMTDSVLVSDSPKNRMVGKSVNMWTEISAQGNLLSLCASSTHVWYTDKSCNIWYSGLTGPGLTWRKANGYATQVSVSPLGNIVWRLYKGVAYAGTKITTKSPEGLKWAQAVQSDVAYICVDETCAW